MGLVENPTKCKRLLHTYPFDVSTMHEADTGVFRGPFADMITGVQNLKRFPKQLQALLRLGNIKWLLQCLGLV